MFLEAEGQGAGELVLVDEVDHFQEEVAGDLEGFDADFVDGVQLGVVVAAFGVVLGGGAVVEVDEIEDRDSALLEGDVVVLDVGVVFEDGAGVAGVFGGDSEEIFEPGRGVLVAIDVEVLVSDHVCDEEGFDLADGAILRPLCG